MSSVAHRTIYCRTRTPVALLIRLGDGMRQWSHEAGILADGEHVVEATALHGVVLTPIAELMRRASEHLIVERTVADKASGDSWALSTLGAGYDWFGVVGKPLNRAWENDTRWFCSEHNTAWHAACGLRLFRPGTRGVGPNDTYANFMGVVQ